MSTFELNAIRKLTRYKAEPEKPPTVLKQYVFDEYFDYYWQSEASKYVPPYIIIYTANLGGLGDLFAAIKLAKIAKHFFSSSEVAVVTEKQKDVMLIRQNLPASIQCYPFRETDPEAKVKGVSIGIASVYQMPSRGYKFLPLMVVKEYAFHNDSFPSYLLPPKLEGTFSCGLGDNEMGIFIDEPPQIPASSSLLDALDSKRALYLSYAHGEMSHFYFFQLVFSYLKKRGNVDDIDFFVGGLTREFLPKQKKLIELLFQRQFLLENDIAKITFIDEKGFQSFEYSEEGRHLNFFMPKESILHSDMLHLFMRSEKLCMVTGDQSFSEAVSFNKQFIYEIWPHKRTLLNEMVRLSTSPLNTFLEKSAINFYERAEKIINYAEIADQLSCHEIVEAYDQFNQLIRTHYNIELRIVAKIQRFFFSQNFSTYEIADREERETKRLLKLVEEK